MDDEKPAQQEPGSDKPTKPPKHDADSPLSQPELPAHASPDPAPAQPSGDHAGPGLIVLQWLTYAFWGWTVLALSSLIVSVLAFYISDSDTSGFAPFGIAAVLVLLPISAVCDFFYSKKEPLKKVGASALVMVIHAVIFALFAIGSVIVAVFSLVNMFTSGSTTDEGAQVALYGSMIIGLLYGATFLRTLRPPKLVRVAKVYTALMIGAIGIIIILAITGPVFRERETRTDRLIESNLSAVSRAVNDYADQNDRLPEDLSKVDLDGSAQELVDKNLVDYKPNTKQATPGSLSRTQSRGVSLTDSLDMTYYYQLCVVYKEKSSYYYASSATYDTYESYVSPHNHPAGEVCYKAKTRY
jgi:hypothetical protein